MNYIEQIKRFWIAQEGNQLSTTEIALYFYLLEVCNKCGWIGQFKRNNAKVLADLSITFKTLQAGRDRLQQAGLISFKTQNGIPNVSYSVIDLCKNSKGLGGGSGQGSGRGLGQGLGGGSGQDNINQTKRKPNQTNSLSGGDPPVQKKEGLPDPSKKQKKDPVEKTKHWQEIVDLWFVFNEKKFSERPSFSGADPRHLKRILEILEKRAEAKTITWTLEVAKERFDAFLEAAFKDPWLSKNFLLTHLEKFIDKIILNHGNNQSIGTARQAKGGGSINELQALKRVPADGPAEETNCAGGKNNPDREEWEEAQVIE